MKVMTLEAWEMVALEALLSCMWPLSSAEVAWTDLMLTERKWEAK